MVSKVFLIIPTNKSRPYRTLIEQGFALAKIDDILHLSNSFKEQKFQLCEQLQNINNEHSLKWSPEQPFFMLLIVKFFLGPEISCNTKQLIHSKVAALQKLSSITGKVAFVSFISALDFYTKFTIKFQTTLKRFHDLLHGNTPCNWTSDHELELLPQHLKTAPAYDTELTIPNTKRTIFNTVDASLIG